MKTIKTTGWQDCPFLSEGHAWCMVFKKECRDCPLKEEPVMVVYEETKDCSKASNQE